MKTIYTERLYIRRFVLADCDDLYDYLSNPSVVKFEPYNVFTKGNCVQEAAARAKNPDFLAVCLRDTDKLIGNLYFSPQDFGTYEMGYVFNARYQHQGYAFESAHALLDYAFQDMNVRRVIAMCNPDNSASWRLLERLGLRREGYLKQNIWFKKDDSGNPIWLDTYEYGILSDEWIKNDAFAK